MRVLLLCLIVLAADTGEAAKKDTAAMQGEWACVSYVREGMKFDDDTAGSLFRSVKGDSYTIYRFRKAVSKGTFKLDTTKMPRHIDTILADGPAKGKLVPGIYKIEGDKLTTCFAQPGGKRPTAFESKEDSGHTLSVWKREK